VEVIETWYPLDPFLVDFYLIEEDVFGSSSDEDFQPEVVCIGSS
jgi:hypothetical protein